MASDTSYEWLDLLLREDVEHARRRTDTSYDLATDGLGQNIVLFGAGGFGRMVNRKLSAFGVHPVAFTDNNPSLWGKNIDGLVVLAPEEAASQYGQQAVFVVCIWNGEAHDRMPDRLIQLKSLGCKAAITFGSLFWKYRQSFLPHYCLDLPEKVLCQKNIVRSAMELWSDRFSRDEFVAQIAFRASLDFTFVSRSVGGKHYFPHDLFSLGNNEVFIDCGAFDGDTIADFVHETGGNFRLLVAFEPDAATYSRLQERISRLDGDVRLKIQSSQKAIGRQTGTIAFDSTGTMLSKIGSGVSKVDVIDLDSAIGHLNPTYIKFDIEGFEPEALMGASGLLSRTRPILALSVYHKQDHLWKIPLLLSSLLPERYEFFLRPHGAESWDLVCYAIPAERAIRPS